MKINWEMVISVTLALVVYGLLEKFVLNKIESYDWGSSNYEGEEYQ